MSKRFQLANPFWWTIVPGGFLIVFLLSYYPNILPLNKLGAIGNVLSNLAKNYRKGLTIGFWITVLIHVFEALIARRICQKAKIDQQSTLFWIIQTFIIGILYCLYIS